MVDRVISALDSTFRRSLSAALPKSLIWVGLGLACWASVFLGIMAVSSLF